MKRVFNTNEIAHVWANQSQYQGRCPASIFFEGATIYSYGKHFPIATIEGNDVLFTLRGYSNSTARHIGKVKRAISDRYIIYCYDVPVKYYGDKKPLNKQSFTLQHEQNTNQWKSELKRLFAELGNKKNRDIAGRINSINYHIELLTRYYNYFGLKIKDAELKKMLAIAATPDFIEQAREALAKQEAANEKKMKQRKKAFDQSIDLWRKYDTEALANRSDKELANFYQNQIRSFTRLRLNRVENRLETSKGVQIPVEIAKRAYVKLNGCMEGSCKDLSIPVMDYTITETGKDYIKAGCHTIPKEDVRYIANLLKW